eukprot:1213912-Rhodomonas_salina.1
MIRTRDSAQHGSSRREWLPRGSRNDEQTRCTGTTLGRFLSYASGSRICPAETLALRCGSRSWTCARRAIRAQDCAEDSVRQTTRGFKHLQGERLASETRRDWGIPMQENLRAELVAGQPRHAVVRDVCQRAQTLVVITLYNDVPAQQADLCPEFQRSAVNVPSLAEVGPHQGRRLGAISWDARIGVGAAHANVRQHHSVSVVDSSDSRHLGVRGARTFEISRSDHDFRANGPGHGVHYRDLIIPWECSSTERCPRNLRLAMDIESALKAGNDLGSKGRQVDRLWMPNQIDVHSAPPQQNVVGRNVDIFSIEDKRPFYENQIEPRQARVDKNNLALWNHDCICAQLIVIPRPTPRRRGAATPRRSCGPRINV